MLLIASIPPSLRGVKFSESANDSVQRQILQSWFNAGFTPVSINTFSELKLNPDHRDALEDAGVDVLEVPSRQGFPDYLPNLVQSLKYIVKAFPDKTIALTNADIHITLDKNTSKQLNSLAPSCFLLSHRIDIDSPSAFSVEIPERSKIIAGSSFLPGIDFLAARPEALFRALPFLGDELTIGLPWWDLLLPMALLAAGASKSHLNNYCFLHIRHSDRWNPNWLDRIGESATRHLNHSIKGYRSPSSAFLWALAYQRLTSPFQPPRIMYSRLKQSLHQLLHGRQCPVYLLDVLRMTEAIVCETGWSLDRRWIEAWQPEPPL